MNMTVTSAGVPKGPNIAVIAVGVIATAALVIAIAALVSVQKIRKAADGAQNAVPTLKEDLGKVQTELSNHAQQNDRFFRAVADELQQQRNIMAALERRLAPVSGAAPAAAAPRGGLPPAGAAPAAGTQDAAAAAAAGVPSGRVHEVVAGDSFGKIARKYNTTVAALETANPGVNSSKLKLGQKINLP